MDHKKIAESYGLVNITEIETEIYKSGVEITDCAKCFSLFVALVIEYLDNNLVIKSEKKQLISKLQTIYNEALIYFYEHGLLDVEKLVVQVAELVKL